MKDGRSVSITRHEAGNGMHSSSSRNLVVSPLSFSSSGVSRPILGSVSSSQPPLYQQNTNAALAQLTASERSYFLKLAQRFYLSLEMVCEAKEVFDRYRELELRSGSRASNTTSVSTVCGGGGDPGRRPTRASSGASRTDENVVEVATLEPLSSATSTHAAQGSAAVEKEGMGVEQVPSSASQADTPRSKSFTAVSGRRTSYFTPPLSTARSCSSGSNIFTEETLGVPGLQAFYLDLGIPKSALEVADVIQSMQSFPQELAMLQRKEAAERYHEEQVAAAEAVAAAMRVEGGGTTRQGSGTALSKGKVEKARQPGSTPEKKSRGKPDGARSTSSPHPRVRSPGGEDVVDSLSMSSSRDAVTAPPTTGFSLVRESAESRGGPSDNTAASPADATRKGLPFPLFLFLLQNRLSEEDGTPAHKDDEVLQAFHALDGDHDGILSEEDIQRALVYLLQEEGVLSEDRDLMELASLHPVELRTAITECDMNADGLVTAEDFLMVLRV